MQQSDEEQQRLQKIQMKLSMLLHNKNKDQDKKKKEFQQMFTSKVRCLEIPQKIYSFSRSLRHFGEIRAKKGPLAVNLKAHDLYNKAEGIYKYQKLSNQIVSSSLQRVKPQEQTFLKAISPASMLEIHENNYEQKKLPYRKIKVPLTQEKHLVEGNYDQRLLEDQNQFLTTSRSFWDSKLKANNFNQFKIQAMRQRSASPKQQMKLLETKQQELTFRDFKFSKQHFKKKKIKSPIPY